MSEITKTDSSSSDIEHAMGEARKSFYSSDPEERKKAYSLFAAVAPYETSGEAEGYLGNIFFYGGYGAEQDYKESYRHYEEGSRRGYWPASVYISEMYLKGVGVKADLAKALEWAKKSQEQGDPYQERFIRETEAKLKEEAEHKEEAKRQEEKRAAEEERSYKAPSYAKPQEMERPSYPSDRSDSFLSKAAYTVYEDENDFKEEPSFEHYYLYCEAERGNPQAQADLGTMFVTGHGVEKDLKKGYHWLKKASESGYIYALNNLGYMYEMGIFVPIDYPTALECYREPYRHGVKETITAIGMMKYDGRGLPQDRKKGLSLICKAAYKGQKDSLVFIRKTFLRRLYFIFWKFKEKYIRKNKPEEPSEVLIPDF